MSANVLHWKIFVQHLRMYCQCWQAPKNELVHVQGPAVAEAPSQRTLLEFHTSVWEIP